MPTKYPRISVTNDRELAEALDRVAPHFQGTPMARMVRELALRGADALEQEEAERKAALERLATLSTERGDLIDWDVLERVRGLAWGHDDCDYDVLTTVLEFESRWIAPPGSLP